MYEIYRYIFYGGLILAIIMLIVTVLVFIFLKIPTVIGDLSGANAKKAIENIRNQNESTGNKTYRTSKVNRERGKLTDKISPSGRLIKQPSAQLHGAMATAKIGTQRLSEEELAEYQATSVLTDELRAADQTTVLTGKLSQRNNETTVLTGELPQAGAETTVLSVGAGGETTVLGGQAAAFVVEREITYIHTVEEIA